MDHQSGVVPNVAPLEAVLDFHPVSAAAGFEWFQRVCLDILRAHPDFSNVVPIGVAGEAQQGLDIRGIHRKTELWGFQCKQERNFGPADVTAAINKVPANPTYPAAQYRVLLSREATDATRRRAADTAGWAILDAADLSAMVRALPLDVAVELVGRHFGAFWIERFLGVERAATFVSPERYFRPYLDAKYLLNHDRPLRGREKVLQRVSDWYAGQGRVLILEARLGMGASKALFDFTRQRTEAVALPQHAIDASALTEIRLGNVLVVVDDADQQGLDALYAYVARDREKRLLLACQPAATQLVIDKLIGAGIPRSDIAQLILEPVGRDATIVLARDTAPLLNEDDLEQIVKSASDTPLATIVTARLMAASSTAEAVGIFNEVTSLHRKVIEGRLDPNLSRDHARLIVRLVAALGPIRHNSPSLINGAMQLGMNEDDTKRTIAAINAVGGFAQRGDKLEVSPSVVRDGVLVDACVRGSAIDPFVQRLYEIYGFEKNLFRNLASAGEAARVTGRPAFFDDLWNRVMVDVVQMDNARRLRFVEAIRGIALLKFTDIIRLLRSLHHNQPENDDQQFGDFLRITANRVDGEMPPIIGDILAIRPELAKAGIDVLWELTEADSRPLHSNPGSAMRVLIDTAGYDGATAAAREAMVEAVDGLLQRADIDERLHSPLDILEPILERDGHASRSRGENLVFQQFAVPLARFATVRDRALDLCIEAIFAANDRRAIRALRIVTKILAGISAHGVSGENAARLLHEQNRVLDACDRLAGEVPSLRQVALRDEMIKYARRSDEIGARIEAVIANIPLDQSAMLYRAVGPDLARNWRIVPNATVESLHKHEEALGREQVSVARTLVAHFPDGVSLRDGLEAVAEVLASAGIVPAPGNVLRQVAIENVDRAVELGWAALDRPASRYVRGALVPLLVQIYSARPEAAAALIAVAQGGAEDVRIAAAAALRWAPLESRDAESDEVRGRFESIARLLNDASAQVRSAVRLSAAHLVSEVPDLAAPLVDAVQGADGELLDWIYSSVPHDDDGNARVTPDVYARLGRRLIAVDNLAWHEIAFLAAGVHDYAAMVYEVLEARLRKPYKSGVRALPHDPSLDSLAKAIVKHHLVAEILELSVRIMSESSEHEYDVRELVGRLYSCGPQETRAALTSLIAVTSGDQLAAIASLLTDAPWGHVFDDDALLVLLVENAFHHGAAVGHRVGASLESALLNRGRTREGRQNSPILVHLCAALGAALERAEPASESQAFFARLLDETKRELERERLEADEAFGPP